MFYVLHSSPTFPTEADGGPDGMGDAQEDSEEDLENSTRKKRNIEDLPELDHQAIEYPAFRKDFYVPHPDIAALSARDVQLLRDELGTHQFPSSSAVKARKEEQRQCSLEMPANRNDASG